MSSLRLTLLMLMALVLAGCGQGRVNSDGKPGPAAQEEGSTDLELFQGDWTAASMVARGVSTDVEFGDAVKLRVTGDELVTSMGPGRGGVFGCTFSLAPGQNPKEIDLRHHQGPGKGMRQLGLYRFDQGTLWLQLGESGGPRPTSMSDGNGMSLHFRRYNDYERAVLAGRSPAEKWFKQTLPAVGCEVLFPFEPLADGSILTIELAGNNYMMTCDRDGLNEKGDGAAGVKTLEVSLRRVSEKFGTPVSRKDFQMPGGQPGVELVFSNSNLTPPIYSRYRLEAIP